MATEAAAIFDVTMAIAAMAAAGAATQLEVTEGIADYTAAMADITAQIGEVEAERIRQIGATKEEGVMALKEQGTQSAYEARLANTQAEMIRSSVENKLGASGVRQTGSPLLAAQQQVDLAYAQAERTTQAGAAAMTLGGTKLKNTFGGIQAQASLMTNEYQRRHAELLRKKTELELYGPSMVGWAAVGGLGGVGQSLFNASQAFFG